MTLFIFILTVYLNKTCFIQFQIDVNKKIKWEYFEKLFDIDRSSVNSRICHKLTANHIKPNNF